MGAAQGGLLFLTDPSPSLSTLPGSSLCALGSFDWADIFSSREFKEKGKKLED